MIEYNFRWDGNEIFTEFDSDNVNDFSFPFMPPERPEFIFRNYHVNKWKEKDVTIIVCQKNTKDFIQLCIESILRFYPDIPIIVSDDESTDDSIQYLEYKHLTNENISLVHYSGKNEVNSHGDQLDNLLKRYVNTKYCLLLDSDCIIERGGFIELMIDELENDNKLYGTGTLIYSWYNSSRPCTPEDNVPYLHPSCSMIRVDIYNSMDNPFKDMGQPVEDNMRELVDKGIPVKCFMVDKYVTHRQGATWVGNNPIWSDDHDVYLRPFVTFITDAYIESNSIDNDFDIVISNSTIKREVVIYKQEPVVVDNNLYPLRFKVHGEYVCYCNGKKVILNENFISELKDFARSNNYPDRFFFEGLSFVKRKVWQKEDCLKSPLT